MVGRELEETAIYFIRLPQPAQVLCLAKPWSTTASMSLEFLSPVQMLPACMAHSSHTLRSSKHTMTQCKQVWRGATDISNGVSHVGHSDRIILLQVSASAPGGQLLTALYCSRTQNVTSPPSMQGVVGIARN